LPRWPSKAKSSPSQSWVKDSDILYRQAKIDKLTHELATLKRWKFGRSSEQLNADSDQLAR
jgi:hypothetical protein